MADINLNMDFSLPVIIEGSKAEWTGSPAQGVERRRLERENAETGRATSIVRFAPGSSFSPHSHPGGEEYLVLDGTFSDSTGDYHKGSYVRNPPGSKHAPFSYEGCTIFVKLCCMKPEGEPAVAIDSSTGEFKDIGTPGHKVMTLFDEKDDLVRLETLEAGTQLTETRYPGGLELLIIEGNLILDGAVYGEQTWARFPAGKSITLASDTGATFWTKAGHLNL